MKSQTQFWSTYFLDCTSTFLSVYGTFEWTKQLHFMHTMVLFTDLLLPHIVLYFMFIYYKGLLYCFKITYIMYVNFKGDKANFWGAHLGNSASFGIHYIYCIYVILGYCADCLSLQLFFAEAWNWFSIFVCPLYVNTRELILS